MPELWQVIALLLSEILVLMFIAPDIHERLHIYFAKGYAKRVRFTHCNFLDGFTTKLPWKNRIASVTVANLWNIAFGLGLLKLAVYFMRTYPQLDAFGIANSLILFLGSSSFAGIGLTSLFPITQDGVVLWNLLISRFRKTPVPMPDLFTNLLKHSRYTRIASSVVTLLWIPTLTLLVFPLMWRWFIELLLITILVNFIASIAVWRNYASRQAALNSLIPSRHTPKIQRHE